MRDGKRKMIGRKMEDGGGAACWVGGSNDV